MAWVQIGPPACDSDLLPHLRNTTFYDIFAAAEPTDDVTCPAGYTPVKTGETKILECLQVLPGMELLASRLETRRHACTACIGGCYYVQLSRGATGQLTLTHHTHLSCCRIPYTCDAMLLRCNAVVN